MANCTVSFYPEKDVIGIAAEAGKGPSSEQLLPGALMALGELPNCFR